MRLDVLIEDPVRECSYFVARDEIGTFRVDASVWSKIDGRTVVFNVPGEGLADEVPPFVQELDADPNILIRHAAGKSAYFLTYEQLQKFKIARQRKPHTEFVRFVIPRLRTS